MTLLRLYDLHTKLLPVLLGGLVIGHVVIVRLFGFADVKGSHGFHPFYPEHTLKMGAIATGVGVPLAFAAAWFLGTGRFRRRHADRHVEPKRGFTIL